MARRCSLRYSQITSQNDTSVPPPMTMEATGLPMKNGVEDSSAARCMRKSSWNTRATSKK